jgi:hypothetical protein
MSHPLSEHLLKNSVKKKYKSVRNFWSSHCRIFLKYGYEAD